MSRPGSTAGRPGAPGTDVRFAQLAAATADLPTPFAVVDLDAFDANAHALVHRAAGKPIRLASKSLRCRELQRRALAVPGFSGVLAFTLLEAIWLADEAADVVVGYPTTDGNALVRLAGDPELRTRVTLMIDCVQHLDVVAAAVREAGGGPVRVALDVDASLEALGGRVHVGALRSHIRTPSQAVALARAAVSRPEVVLVGLMSYEAQIAGVGDRPRSRARGLAVRAMQRRSAAELLERRTDVVEAVRRLAPLEFVNGGGTGSVELTASDDSITEIAAGSGLYGPSLFDTYRTWQPDPAAFFVLDVVRRPSASVATVLGGGWIASGAPGRDRLPTPVWPRGLRLTRAEGAGEVQTPLRGAGARGLAVGDRVWFRHAKAGELSERVDELHLVQGDTVEATPTYRGEGHAFL